jgi:hypothetical protein
MVLRCMASFILALEKRLCLAPCACRKRLLRVYAENKANRNIGQTGTLEARRTMSLRGRRRLLQRRLGWRLTFVLNSFFFPDTMFERNKRQQSTDRLKPWRLLRGISDPAYGAIRLPEF